MVSLAPIHWWSKVIDAHCHLESVPQSLQAAQSLEMRHVFTISVTSSPANYAALRPYYARYKWVKLALGFHPLHAANPDVALKTFERYVSLSPYIGEIGLDFSPQGWKRKDAQIYVFRKILGLLNGHKKFVSLHSRRAESAVLDVLDESGIGPVVFHWYTGSLNQLDRLISKGHFCSVNSAMIRSKTGRALIERMPMEHVLTETDGPYARLNNQPLQPGDVQDAAKNLSEIWHVPQEECNKIIERNLRRLVASI